MKSHAEADAFIGELNPRVARLAQAAHQTLVRLGCNSYVKTIYIGYDLDGEMVAALYPHADRVEIALALDEHRQDSLLVDASHLTWRTLPLAAVIISAEQVISFAELGAEAVDRVRSAQHTVMRDNDFFKRRRIR